MYYLLYYMKYYRVQLKTNNRLKYDGVWYEDQILYKL